ncbi:biotin carboxylase N-terminal domain-containing protein [Nonomuraea sp. NPDC049750]|uniref:acetyl/propionyl/methylcrotonyl-CoA carboxylase subunit alpha n=1 Tax=Nonomuraea sp. NPDC049750 TaxID=3154738 RepID=UPI0033D156F0
MFTRVLVANRGEIAVRVIRTLRALGITSVAVHTASDADARHVREADTALQIPKYLDMGAMVAAAEASGAQAVHPGYGFLAENAEFARRCAEAGLVFVGPPPAAIDAMGDKIRAKATVSAAGVPVVPGGAEPGDSLLSWTDFPALIKPSAGGGGKGMVLVRSAAELPDALESARRTARSAFGDATLLIERYVENPRHIEIQVLADTHGNVVHLGERECSLQRRHQKIIEEAPSPFVDAAMRERMGAAAVEAARAVGYVSAGTVEFIVDGTTGEYHFMEMNTRLQVEHPVTELVTDLDLVELQLRVAAGEPLPFTQDEVRLRGHAVEARVYAEDPSRGFLPTGGRVLRLAEPGGVRGGSGLGDSGVRIGSGLVEGGIRVDSGLVEGGVVGSEFDPMLAKVIAWAPTREAAFRRLDQALAETVVLGVITNVPFLRALAAHPEVRAGELDTGLVERVLPALVPAAGPPDEVLAAAALVFHTVPQGSDPWEVADGWRVGERAWTTWRLESRDGVHTIQVRGLPEKSSEIRIGCARQETGEAVQARLLIDSAKLTVTLAGRTQHYTHARHDDTLWLGRDGQSWALTRHRIGDPGDRPGTAHAGDGVVRSPMPGTVLVVKAQPGDQVSAGQPLLIVEAMKMEHTVTAPCDGRVTELPVQAGQPVDMDAVLAVVTAGES